MPSSSGLVLHLLLPGDLIQAVTVLPQVVVNVLHVAAPIRHHDAKTTTTLLERTTAGNEIMIGENVTALEALTIVTER